MNENGHTQRILIIVIVVAFFVSSFGLTALVIWDSSNGGDSDLQAGGHGGVQANNQAQQEQGDTLEGTKLANFEPVAEVNELQIIDIEEGTGQVVGEGASVVAHYTGALAQDGTIFQSSLDAGQPIPFSLAQVIQGWQEGVPGMKVGGKRRIIIPAEKAYGAQSPSPNIPANAALVFDIEMTAVE